MIANPNPAKRPEPVLTRENRRRGGRVPATPFPRRRSGAVVSLADDFLAAMRRVEREVYR